MTRISNTGSAYDIHIIEKGGYKFAVAVGERSVSIIQIVER